MPMIDDGKRAPRAPEDLTLRLGPRIGQRLGEAGDREICGRGPSAPWLGEFLTELLSFPNGRHDDQVDSVSQFLRWLQNDAYQNPVLCPPILITRADMGLPPLHIDWSCRH